MHGFKKIHGSGTKTLIFSNKEMNKIMKLVQTLEDSNILLKNITEKFKMKQKAKRMIFRNVTRNVRS